MEPRTMLFTLLMSFAVLIFAFVGAALVANWVKSPRPLPLEKPSLAIVPKYYVAITPSEIQWERLTNFLEQQGFRAVVKKSGRKQLIRGSIFGDLSIKYIKVAVSEMEDYPERLSIAYNTSVLFDTGDLWKFAKEIEEMLTAPN